MSVVVFAVHVRITTVPNGAGDLRDAYDRDADMHRGITTFLVKWKL